MSFKEALILHCHQLVDDRIMRVRKLVTDAQQAANLESKSSAGDKYETGRAMMMIEREKAESQLGEAMKLKRTLDTINLVIDTECVSLGSLVTTSSGNYFISASLGKLMLENKEIFALSAVSPLGKLLMGKRLKDYFLFNSQTIEILAIE